MGQVSMAQDGVLQVSVLPEGLLHQGLLHQGLLQESLLPPRRRLLLLSPLALLTLPLSGLWSPALVVSGAALAQSAHAAPRRAPRAKPNPVGPDGMTVAQLSKFLRNLQGAVKGGSAVRVAEWISFPLRVNVEGSPRRLIGTTLFLAEYASVFPPDVRTAVMNQKFKDITRDAKGALLANGSVWIAGICDDLECTTPTPKLVAINLPLR